MFAKVSIFAVVLASFLSGTEAHGYMASPAPRARTISGHQFQWEPQSDGQFNGECKDNNRVGPIQATYTQGSEITVTIDMTAPHNGAYQLRFCPQADGNNACFSQNLAIPITAPSYVLPNFPNAHQGSSGNAVWRLPADLVCDHCAMQFWYQNNNGVQEHFKSCHDVRIVSNDGSMPPSSSSSTSTSTSSSATTGATVTETVYETVCAAPTSTSTSTSTTTSVTVTETVYETVCAVPTSTSTSTSISSSAPPAGECVALWGRCGGKGTPTLECCQGKCNTADEWYFQCQ
jgi:predicted carbohydrate-binding protein with CBM5 and CBM33 domain